MNGSKVQPFLWGVVASMNTDIWINTKNTYLVRNMKNPSPLEGNKWPSRNHVLEVLAGFSGDGKGKSKDGAGIKVSLETLCRLTKHNVSFICKTLSWWVKSSYLIESNIVKKGSRVTHEYELNLELILQNQEADIHQKTVVRRTNVNDTTIVQRTNVEDPTIVQGTNDNCSTDNRQLFYGQLEQCFNKDLKNVRNAREDFESFKIEIEEPKLEDEMSEARNPLFDKLKSYNLTDKQIEEVLAIEHMNGGYVQSNISYFENHLKKIQLENPAAYLISCLRGNWAKWGEGVLRDTPPKPTTMSYTPPSTVVPINTPLSRKEVSDRRFGRARAATEEQRKKWMKIAEYLDEFCLVQFDNMPGLTRDDFVTFTHPPEGPDGRATPFKSCVTRLMEAVERAEQQAERERQKYLNQSF